MDGEGAVPPPVHEGTGGAPNGQTQATIHEPHVVSDRVGFSKRCFVDPGRELGAGMLQARIDRRLIAGLLYGGG